MHNFTFAVTSDGGFVCFLAKSKRIKVLDRREGSWKTIGKLFKKKRRVVSA